MIEYSLLVILIAMLVWQSRKQQQPLLQPAMDGLHSGVGMCKRVLPTVAGYVLAFACFRAVGGFDWLLHYLHPVLQFLGIPDELFPVLLARPFSGSLANGLFADLANSAAPTVLLTQAAVMLGSTETTLYVIMVYFAYVGVKKSRYAIPLGLIIDLLGCWLAVWVSLLFLK